MTRNSLDKHTDNYHRGLDELPQAQETTPLLNVREIISEFWIDLLLELLPKSPVPSHNHDPNSGEMDWESANPSNNLEQPSEGEEPSFEDQQVDDIEELGDTLERISPEEIRKRNQQTLRFFKGKLPIDFMHRQFDLYCTGPGEKNEVGLLFEPCPDDVYLTPDTTLFIIYRYHDRKAGETLRLSDLCPSWPEGQGISTLPWSPDIHGHTDPLLTKWM
ncbi:MAG: hypothetical protein MMC23_005523 [Stictis urceolatum]|nr:hypothetical protein [Stictis urceolata]